MPAFPDSEPAGADLDEDTAALENLPRRVRQANLAPQLRKPVAQPESQAPERSPEQVRTLMSALQLGTTRGRIDASRVDAARVPPAPEPAPTTAGPNPEKPSNGHAEEPSAATFGDAATVTFPALVDVTAARDKAQSGTDAGAPGDRAAGPGENLRLEKDT